MSTEKKFVLITGCTPGGIGYALAVAFQKRGHHVIATARHADILHSLTELGMSAVSLEVTNPKSVAACRTEVERITGGRLDILINNAGRSHIIPATDIDLDDVRLTYETNIFGPMLMCQALIAMLIAARGLIINVSSLSSVMPIPFRSVYSSTKAALDAYSRSLRIELRPFHVRVMVARVGTVRSNVTSRIERKLPQDSIYRPAEDVFRRRLQFSQESAATMPTDAFAEQLVGAALRGEGSMWLGGRFGGTPDWFWGGGMAGLVWLMTWLPYWCAEALNFVTFGVGEVEQKIALRAKQD